MVKKDKLFEIIGQIFLIVFLLVYFTNIAPIPPFDGDDWYFIGSMRIPFPIWGAWNPSKVLPEVLMPLGGYLGAFVIYPITHNYIFSITLAETLVICIFCFLFFWMFYQLLRKKFELSVKISLAGEFFIFIMFFFPFFRFNSPSVSAFWTADLVCVFNYLIPGLLSASIVFSMEQVDDFPHWLADQSSLKQGLFIVAIYFAVFSSTQLNIILVSYILVGIFYRAFGFLISQQTSDGNSFKSFFLSIYIYLFILLMWLIAVLFDLHGGRAKNVTNVDLSLQDRLQNSIFGFKKFINLWNHVFIIGSLVLVTVAFILLKKEQDKKTEKFMRNMMFNFVALFISVSYLFIVYTKIGTSNYLMRIDAMWPVVFYVLYLVCISFVIILKYMPVLRKYASLFIIVLFLVIINYNEGQQLPSNWNGHDAKTVYNVDNYIVNQITSADKKGQSVVKVKVPIDSRDNKSDNWPHPLNMANWMQNALFAHHMTRTRIKVIFVPDKKVNTRFYENRSNEQQFTSLEN
ncbi:hypothetical protein [uncultured Lentilactobacillus sp.]|uniref:hypothetical protein n=1 Tax=uncultured Lentilactobacillus sp. TaxID=2805375 RepID=UPI002595BBDF|nr:hypothetical protein [uncultured Lentilactobacillus sp.]